MFQGSRYAILEIGSIIKEWQRFEEVSYYTLNYFGSEISTPRSPGAKAWSWWISVDQLKNNILYLGCLSKIFPHPPNNIDRVVDSRRARRHWVPWGVPHPPNNLDRVMDCFLCDEICRVAMCLCAWVCWNYLRGGVGFWHTPYVELQEFCWNVFLWCLEFLWWEVLHLST